MMKTKKHSSRQHAVLSASGASRWMSCTPSARLEEQYGVKTTSKFADEGTLAHELSELYLRNEILNEIDSAAMQTSVASIMANELFKQEMPDYVRVYVDYCTAMYNKKLTESGSAMLMVEQKLDLSDYVPDSFGTADCVIIADGQMDVIDLKYGKGVPVYATHNPQLMLYGLGALLKYSSLYEITSLRLTVVQPRLYHVSTWDISAADLENWAETELRQKADDAFNGRGELNSGDWCRFCSVKAKCRKLYEESLELARNEFATDGADMHLLSDTEVANILSKAGTIKDYLDAVSDYALQQAVDNHKQWPGFKVVTGRSQRKWIDADAAMDAIGARHPECPQEELFEIKPKTVTQIEKMFGKKLFNAEFSDLVVKAEGAPTLVPDDDRRVAINQAYEDFKQ